jgi:hypothetical protein
MTVTADVPVTPLLDPDELPLPEDDEAPPLPPLELDPLLEPPDDELLPPPEEPLLAPLLLPPLLELDEEPLNVPFGEEPPHAAATTSDRLASEARRGSFIGSLGCCATTPNRARDGKTSF